MTIGLRSDQSLPSAAAKPFAVIASRCGAGVVFYLREERFGAKWISASAYCLVSRIDDGSDCETLLKS